MDNLEDIEDILNSIDTGDLAGVTSNMSTEFSAAMKNAVDLKMKGPKFDSFESLVRHLCYT
jgi:hypothetical protein